MKRFENAKPGDEVYCRLRGEGKIVNISNDSYYNIEIRFSDKSFSSYTYEGRLIVDHKEPTLFYRKGNEKYLTERPEIDLNKVYIFSNGICEYKLHKIDDAFVWISLNDSRIIPISTKRGGECSRKFATVEEAIDVFANLWNIEVFDSVKDYHTDKKGEYKNEI